MIPKRIDHDPDCDNYRALAIYIADAALGKTPGEKTLFSWYSGGLGDTANYWQGLEDVELAQTLNQRSKAGKTYHLMVSFRPEDEGKLTEGVLRDIEGMLAAALGFYEHQRHCGVHLNTANLHMHIAFSMIHPQTYNRHAPYRDQYKLLRACRAIEQKYGLTVDKGMEPDAPKRDRQASAKIQTIESQSGQESLFSYVLRHKPDIMAKLTPATSWPEVHVAFLQNGLSLVPAGNGLKIKDRYGKHHVKPSVIDRLWSKANLEARFGPLETPSSELLQSVKAGRRYEARPLQVNPERDGLYQDFLTEIAARRSTLASINQEGARLYEAHKEKWEQKRRGIKLMPMLKADRQRVNLALQNREREELASLRANVAMKRKEARAERPYTSWNTYLQHLAGQGHETALAILRSKNMEVQPEAAAVFQVNHQSHEPERPQLKQEQRALNAPGISYRHQRALLTVFKMRELIEEENASGNTPLELRFRIDGKGTVIFNVPGGAIRDNGREITFSAGSGAIKDLALKFAKKRWGDHSILSDSNTIRFDSGKVRQKSTVLADNQMIK